MWDTVFDLELFCQVTTSSSSISCFPTIFPSKAFISPTASTTASVSSSKAVIHLAALSCMSGRRFISPSMSMEPHGIYVSWPFFTSRGIIRSLWLAEEDSCSSSSARSLRYELLGLRGFSSRVQCLFLQRPAVAVIHPALLLAGWPFLQTFLSSMLPSPSLYLTSFYCLPLGSRIHPHYCILLVVGTLHFFLVIPLLSRGAHLHLHLSSFLHYLWLVLTSCSFLFLLLHASGPDITCVRLCSFLSLHL